MKKKTTIIIAIVVVILIIAGIAWYMYSSKTATPAKGKTTPGTPETPGTTSSSSSSGGIFGTLSNMLTGGSSTSQANSNLPTVIEPISGTDIFSDATPTVNLGTVTDNSGDDTGDTGDIGTTTTDPYALSNLIASGAIPTTGP